MNQLLLVIFFMLMTFFSAQAKKNNLSIFTLLGNKNIYYNQNDWVYSVKVPNLSSKFKMLTHRAIPLRVLIESKGDKYINKKKSIKQETKNQCEKLKKFYKADGKVKFIEQGRESYCEIDIAKKIKQYVFYGTILMKKNKQMLVSHSITIEYSKYDSQIKEIRKFQKTMFGDK